MKRVALALALVSATSGCLHTKRGSTTPSDSFEKVAAGVAVGMLVVGLVAIASDVDVDAPTGLGL